MKTIHLSKERLTHLDNIRNRKILRDDPDREVIWELPVEYSDKKGKGKLMLVSLKDEEGEFIQVGYRHSKVWGVLFYLVGSREDLTKEDILTLKRDCLAICEKEQKKAIKFVSLEGVTEEREKEEEE